MTERRSSDSPTVDVEFAPIRSGVRTRTMSDASLSMATRLHSAQRDTMMIEEGDRQELQRIATSISQRRQSLAAVSSGIPDLTPDAQDPALDPTSKDFDLAQWLPHFMQQLQEGGVSLKAAGVAYKDLSVSGTGAALQLQQTLADVIQAPVRIGEHLSFGKKEPKRILNRFDGLLRGGELLIVLGRPGSGCSTLLKTITGELEGLGIGESSNIHYNGISQKDMMKEFKGETTYNQEASILAPTVQTPTDTSPNRSTSTSLISPSAKPSNSQLPAACLPIARFSSASPAKSLARLRPRLSWRSVVSATPTTPRSATTLSVVSREESGSV